MMAERRIWNVARDGWDVTGACWECASPIRWFDRAGAISDINPIYDEYQAATDAAMNYGDGYAEGRRDLDADAMGTVLASEAFADWLRIIGRLGEDDRLAPGFARDLAKALAVEYRQAKEEVSRR